MIPIINLYKYFKKMIKIKK